MFHKLSFPAFLFAGLALVLALTSGCSTNTPTPLMKRANLFLEDSDWQQANEYFDKVLDIDPEYCLYRQVVYRVKSTQGRPSGHSHFQKAVRFADARYKAKIKGFDKKIRDRIQQAAQQVKDSAEKAKQAGAGKRMELTINGIEYPFRWCPPGTFMMGSPANEPGRDNDETQHQVKLTQDFWLLETEVTQAMWEGVMGSNPSYSKGSKGSKLPVENVSWYNCQEYIKKLNDLGVAPKGYRFSLPTEAQWEYACRAGTTTAFCFGDTLTGKQANFSNVGKTSEVGSYPANAWGLHDMHGNVYEWCLDWYGEYPSGAVTDPTGAVQSSIRVLRGGSWRILARHCRSAYRSSFVPSNKSDYVGLRVSLVLQ